jgi:XTP/dITP diphosphohydrolase
MWISSMGKTFAQMPEEEKNALSHRGQAARAMLELMRTRWFA